MSFRKIGSGSDRFWFGVQELEIGSGSAGSVPMAGSAGSGSKTVWFPVRGSVRGLPVDPLDWIKSTGSLGTPWDPP